MWPRSLALAAVWLATRAIAVISIDMTPWMLHDLEVYTRWVPGLRLGQFPVGDETWQYPPGASLLFLTASSIPVDFRWAFTLVVLALDAALMATLIIAFQRQPGASPRGPWLWAVAGVVVGPIMLTRFDVAPTLFAVLAVVLVGRPAFSGAASAIGALIKVWPGLMLISLPRKGLRSGLLSFIIVGALLVLSFLLVFDDSLSFLSNQRDRGLQVESTGALPYLLYSLAGGHVESGLTFGSIQILMRGAETIGTVLTIIGLAVIAVVAWWRLRSRLEDVPAGDVALTVMLVSVASSRVYSPQFNTWIIGLAAAALLATRTRLTSVCLMLVIVSLLTQFVYPWSATQLVHGGALVIVVQSLRIILLLAATVLSVVAIAPQRSLSRA